MAALPLVILDIDVTALSAEVLLNGVVVSESSQLDTLSRSAKINAWAVSGANSLLVRLARLPTVAREDDAPEPAFEVRVRRAMPGGADADDELLASYVWQTSAQPLAGPARQQVFEATLRLEAPMAWTWTRGYAFTTLTPADRGGVADVLNRLRLALADRDVETVVRLQTVQVGEQAVALGQSPGAFIDGYRSFLAERMSSPDWRVAPFLPAGLQINGMADGRIQHVAGGDGGPPIITSAGESRFAIDPYLSKIDGVWTIVR